MKTQPAAPASAGPAGLTAQEQAARDRLRERVIASAAAKLPPPQRERFAAKAWLTMDLADDQALIAAQLEPLEAEHARLTAAAADNEKALRANEAHRDAITGPVHAKRVQLAAMLAEEAAAEEAAAEGQAP
jgi:hypothetical protein